jgi:hypothetical protein
MMVLHYPFKSAHDMHCVANTREEYMGIQYIMYCLNHLRDFVTSRMEQLMEHMSNATFSRPLRPK